MTGLDRREPQVEGAPEEDPGLGVFFFHAEVRDVAPRRRGAGEPARIFEMKREAVAGFVQEILGNVFAEFHRADARIRRGRGEGDALGDHDHAVRHGEEVSGAAAGLRFREILRRCDAGEVGAQLTGDALNLFRINGLSGVGFAHVGDLGFSPSASCAVTWSCSSSPGIRFAPKGSFERIG